MVLEESLMIDLPAEVRFKILLLSSDNLVSIALSCKSLYNDISNHYFIQEKYYHIYKAILYKTIKNKRQKSNLNHQIDNYTTILKGKPHYQSFIDQKEKEFWSLAGKLRFHLLGRMIAGNRGIVSHLPFIQKDDNNINVDNADKKGKGRYGNCLQPIIFEMNHKYAKQLIFYKLYEKGKIKQNKIEQNRT